MSNKADKLARISQPVTMITLVIVVFVLYQQAAVNKDMAARYSALANTAQADQYNAESKLRIARSNELAAEANYFRDRDFSLSLLLGVESFKEADTLEAKRTLLTTMKTNPQLRRYLSGHNADVRSVTYSSDGNFITSGGGDNVIILWDAKTGEPIGKPFVGHEGPVTDLTFSPDNKILASSGTDNKVILWDIETHLPIGEPLVGPPNPNYSNPSLYSVAFSPDGKTLVSGNMDGTLAFWDVENQKLIEAIQTCEILQDKSASDFFLCRSWVISLAFSPDGKTLAAGDAVADTVVLWDVESRKPIDTSIKEHAVHKVSFSPDGKFLAIGAYTEVVLWDVVNHNTITRIPGEVPEFSPDGKWLAIVARDKPTWKNDQILLYDLNKRYIVGQPFDGHSDRISDIAFSPDGKTIASASSDHTIALWNVEWQYPLVQASRLDQDLNYLPMVLSPDGNTFALGVRNNTIVFRDTNTFEQIREPLVAGTATNEYFYDLAFSPDGRFLTASSSDKFVYLWDLETQQLDDKFMTGFHYLVNALAFSPDGNILAMAGPDKVILLWDMKTHQPIQRLSMEHTEGITDLAFNHDGTLLASGGDDRNVIVWDMKTLLPILHLSGHAYYIKDVLFSPDGKLLASSSGDNAILLNNIPDGSYFTGYLYDPRVVEINSMDFSPDGKTLAWCGGSGVSLWDITSKKFIGNMPDWSSIPNMVYLSNIVFTSDGKKLITTDDYQGTRFQLWDIDPQSWVEKSCQRAGRNFTRAEWVEYFSDKEYRATCPQWPLEQ